MILLERFQYQILTHYLELSRADQITVMCDVVVFMRL